MRRRTSITEKAAGNEIDQDAAPYRFTCVIARKPKHAHHPFDSAVWLWGLTMLDDAIYYSRRQADELVAARQAANTRAGQIHTMLADRYGQLAQRALATIPEDAGLVSASPRVIPISAGQGAQRRFR